METWFWLSFCDLARPKGEKFLYAAIIKGSTFADVSKKAEALGLGSEAIILDIACKVPPPDVEVPARFVGRRLDRNDIVELRDFQVSE